MRDFASLFFFIAFVAWILVSITIYRIYSTGTGVTYSLKYKAMEREDAPDKKGKFHTYLATLWILEIISGISTIVFFIYMI